MGIIGQQLYLEFRLIRTELWRMILWILQLTVVLFTVFYCSWTFLLSIRIFHENYHSEASYAFTVDMTGANHQQFQEIILEWCDQKKLLYSVVSVILQNGDEVYVVVGDSEVLPSNLQEMEKDRAFIMSDTMSDYEGKKLRISINGSDNGKEFTIEKASKPVSSILVGLGVYDVTDKLILYLDSETYFQELGYYEDAVFASNMIWKGDEHTLEQFTAQLEAAGVKADPFDYNQYIDLQFGRTARMQELYLAFYGIVIAFLLVNIWISFGQMIERHAREFAVEYLCGGSQLAICVRMAVMLVFVFGGIGILISRFAEQLKTNREEVVFACLVVWGFLCLILIGGIVKIRRQLSERKLLETVAARE